MNRRTETAEQGTRRTGRLGRWLRSWILDPVSFSLDLDQGELDHYLMDPESRVATARPERGSLLSGGFSASTSRPSREWSNRGTDARVA